MRRMLAILFVVAMGAAAAAWAEEQEKPFQLEPGFVRLDNGRDLDGWRAYPAKNPCFRVVDGVIHAGDAPGGPGGGLLESKTRHSRNVVIRFEYRAARGADSGVFLHGRQFQVRDYPNSLPDTKQFAPFAKPPGQWNTMEFDVTDGVARVKLNGTVIVPRWPIGQQSRRGFGLQKEKGDFDFRYVRMKEKSP